MSPPTVAADVPVTIISPVFLQTLTFAPSASPTTPPAMIVPAPERLTVTLLFSLEIVQSFA